MSTYACWYDANGTRTVKWSKFDYLPANVYKFAFACVVCDSIAKDTDSRLTTMMVKMPSFILSEFNEHREFSCISTPIQSVPVHKQIEQVMRDPFIPTEWSLDQPSESQAFAGELASDLCDKIWLSSRDQAVKHAEMLAVNGIHNQLVGRLLEPYSLSTVVVSSTDWSCFFDLYRNPAAQPQMQHVAQAMHKAYRLSQPKELEKNDWHLPFIRDSEMHLSQAALLSLSTARCARASFATRDANIVDIAKDTALYRRLLSKGQTSAFGHVAAARSVRVPILRSNFDDSWTQLRKIMLL